MSARNVPDPVGIAALSAAVFDAIGVQVGAEVLADAKRAVPVLTGHLRDDLAMDIDTQARVIKVGARTARYAGAVELGTSKMAAQPYLRPALYKNRAVSG